MYDTKLPAAPAEPTAHTAKTSARPERRRLRWIVAAIVGLVVLMVVAYAARLALPAWQGYRAAQELLALARGNTEQVDPQQVQAAVLGADAAVAGLESGLRPLYPALRALKGVPRYGPTLAATPELMAAGRAFSALAAEAAPDLHEVFGDGELLARAAAFAGAIGNDPARLDRMAILAEDGVSTLQEIDAASLHPAIGGRLQALSPLAKVLPSLLRALPSVPTLLGMDKPHSYLVLVQNNHELRATGGFITAVGRVTLDQGKITEMDFADSYSIYRPTSHYPAAPRPMQQYMGIPYLTFRDSNWSPDLATTTEIARTLYAMDAKKNFDDVVTLDLNAVQGIIAALSPLTLSGIDEPVTGDNIVAIMKELWAQPADSEANAQADLSQWWRERKDFIPRLAQAVMAKVMGGKANPLALGAAVIDALDQRDVQFLVLSDAAQAAASVFAEMGWDGALRAPESGDFLALVDTNMGYNKVDAAIEREIAHSVTWPTGGGPAEATTVITYTHTFTGTPNLCEPKPVYGAAYDDMIERCYFDYVRLYVPGGSTLIAIDGVEPESASSQRSEKGTRLLAGYLKVEPGQQKVITFRYTLPEELTPDAYSLRIQRQAGTSALPVTLDIGDWEAAFDLTDGVVEWRPPGS